MAEWGDAALPPRQFIKAALSAPRRFATAYTSISPTARPSQVLPLQLQSAGSQRVQSSQRFCLPALMPAVQRCFLTSPLERFQELHFRRRAVSLTGGPARDGPGPFANI